MSGSNSTQKWSLDEARSAIKTAFILRIFSEDSVPKMRYTDIERDIASWGQTRTLHPKMLSKAIVDLRNKGDLKLEVKGKEKWYSYNLKEDRTELISLHANVDATIVNNSSRVGGIADFDEGWSYYGIPDVIKSRFRPKLRRASRSFIERINNIFEEEFDVFVKATIATAKGRVDARDVRTAEKCLWRLYDIVSSSGWNDNLQLLAYRKLEQVAPGSVSLITTKVAKELPSREDGRITYIADSLGVPREKVTQAIDFIQETHRGIQKLLDALPNADKEKITTRLSAMITARYSLVGVIR